MRWLTLLVAVTAAASVSAHARAQAGEYRTRAEVVRVTPIVNRGADRVPVKRCTWEAAPDSLRYRGYPRQPDRDRYFKRCRTTYETEVLEQVEGYRVTFRVGDETFHERLTQRPGGAIAVKVKVTPLNP